MSRVRDLASILTASSVLGTDVEITTAVSDHSAASDPHAGYVLESLIDAKGDLIVGSADNTVAKLSTGNSGESIVADSSTSTGLRYTAGTVQGNPVLNSAMQIWQRGTTIACTSTSYSADRWQGYRTVAGATVTRQATGDTTNLPNIQYAARVQRDSGNTSTTAIYFAQSWESVNSIPFAGKTITFSFYARAGANYSSASNALSVSFLSGTGTDQNWAAAYTGTAFPIATTATLTTTWQRFTYTASVASNVTEISMYFNYTPVGTAGANDYFEMTGVQVDIGSVALPFRTYAGTIQGELAACMRYYFKSSGGQVGIAPNTTDVYVTIPNVMRAAPTVVTPTSAVILDRYGVGNYTQSSAAVVSSGTYVSANASGVIYTNFTGLTAGIPYVVRNDGGSVILSSEL